MPSGTSTELRMVLVIVNADSSVGYASCKDLIHRLAGVHTPTPFPWMPDITEVDNPSQTYPYFDSLTLILACQNRASSELACSRLLTSIDKSIQNAGQFTNATTFRPQLEVEAESVDLESTTSISGFAERLKKRHAYLSHLVLCGYAERDVQLASSHNAHLTAEENMLSKSYSMLREVETLLYAYRAPPARVLWVPSIHSDASSREVLANFVSALNSTGPQNAATILKDSPPRANAGRNEISRIRHTMVWSDLKEPHVCHVQELVRKVTQLFYYNPECDMTVNRLSGLVVTTTLLPSLLLLTSGESVAQSSVRNKSVSDDGMLLLQKFKRLSGE